jgi:5-formyltetrahydrofolate cyclo-ligase
VETIQLLDQMLEEGKQVVVPRSLPENRQLEHIRYSGQSELAENELGILEPIGGERIDPDHLDLVLVPLLAADMEKNRLGYGLGFYDRFLEGLTATKAGLMFSVSLSDERLPVSEFDVTLDYLITEEGIL